MLRNMFTMLVTCTVIAAVGCTSGEAESGADDTDKKDKTISSDTGEKKMTSAETDPAKFTHPIRDEKNKIVTLETNHGAMTLELYHDIAPAHADSFFARVDDEFYKGLIFHRVKEGFMIQGGDPLGTGTGGAGYNINAEFSDNPHKEGTLSMARSNDPNSASSQFFVCLKRTAFLDGKYTVFGQLLKGYDVLHSIGSTKTTAQDRPVEEVKILNCFESDAEGNSLKKKE